MTKYRVACTVDCHGVTLVEVPQEYDSSPDYCPICGGSDAEVEELEE